MKLLVIGFLCFTRFVVAKKCKKSNVPRKFTLLHTNDIHSHLDEFNKYGTSCNQGQIDKNECYGHVARIKTVVDSFRAQSQDVILVDAGDQFQGTLFFNLYGGSILSEMMNDVGYDAMTLGNHEFDTGMENLVKFMNGANFPFVSSNIDVSGTIMEGLVQPYIILEKYKLGIIGYITKTTPDIVGDINVAGLKFSDPVAPVQEAVDELKAKGIKRIICVSHNGYMEDQKLAKATSGIDLIVGGHSHTLLLNSVEDGYGPYPTAVQNREGKPTFVVQAYRFGHYLGHVDIEYDADDNLISITGDPILIDQTIKLNAPLATKVTEWKKGFVKFEEDILTEATAEFPTNCYNNECAIGTLITDCIIREQSGKGLDADVSFINAGGIRASIGKGPVSFANVMTILPFGNAIVSIEMSGQQIVDIIESIAAGKNKDGKSIISFPQWSGVEFTLDNKKPEFQKLVELKIGGILVDLNARYTVLTVDFVAGGGDNIMPKTPYISGDGLAETFVSCLRKKESISPDLKNYIEYANA
jgi:5'-nucleotidase